MKSIRRCALLVVLTLAAGPPDALAQRLVCSPIQRGETATRLAQRITGDARNLHQPWFQIVDPAASRFVSKAEYDRIRPGWHACIANEPVESSAGHANHLEAAGGSLQSLMADALRTIGGVDLTLVWLAAVVVVPWLWWRILEDYFGRRKAVLIVMRHFADRFIREFERPLIRQHATERPVRSRIRFSPHQARFDILLSPGTGRRYPNLSDHKKNLEYDVARVMHLIADKSFVSGSLYAREGWVVVPFQLKVGTKQAGVACISSS